MGEITIEYQSEIQYRTIVALFESFQDDSINIDKFIFWCTKSYNCDNSVCIKLLKSMGSI